MNKYTATVRKTGNSYALRVPKSYIDERQLSLEDKTTLPPAQKNYHKIEIEFSSSGKSFMP